jgi:hypothetical protein
VTDACQQCGKAIVQPRGGSRPKKFCSGACRARWNRGKRPKAEKPKSLPARAARAAISTEERLRDLEGLYRRLLADVETEGTLIPSGQGGALKGNPSAALLVRVAAELARLEAARAAEKREEVEEDGDDIGAALRAVS